MNCRRPSLEATLRLALCSLWNCSLFFSWSQRNVRFLEHKTLFASLRPHSLLESLLLGQPATNVFVYGPPNGVLRKAETVALPA